VGSKVVTQGSVWATTPLILTVAALVIPDYYFLTSATRVFAWMPFTLTMQHMGYSYLTQFDWSNLFYFWNLAQVILALVLLFAGFSAYRSKSVEKMRMIAVASVLLLLTYLYLDYQFSPGWWNGGLMGVTFIYNPATGFFLFPFHETFLAFLAILALRLHKPSTLGRRSG
jgi:hypothetical protein